jgi:hypothetical protein
MRHINLGGRPPDPDPDKTGGTGAARKIEMAQFIKTAAMAGQQEEADAKIRSTVETIIADVAKRGRARTQRAL